MTDFSEKEVELGFQNQQDLNPLVFKLQGMRDFALYSQHLAQSLAYSRCQPFIESKRNLSLFDLAKSRKFQMKAKTEIINSMLNAEHCQR